MAKNIKKINRSNEAYKPIKIKRALNSKDMSLGNNLIISIFIFLLIT